MRALKISSSQRPDGTAVPFWGRIRSTVRFAGWENLLPSTRDARGRMTALPPALRAKQWVPGQSGNPSGKGGPYHEMQRLAREFTPEATACLIEVARDRSEDTRNRIVAMSMLYDRAWGRAKDFDPAAEQAQQKPTFDPSLYTSKELETLHATMLLMARR
jgi:hypothetical protein